MPDQESADKSEAWVCQAEESVLLRLSEHVLIEYVPAPVTGDSGEQTQKDPSLRS